MRKVLSKRIPRDLKKNFLKYLGMLIILVCTISIGSSFQSTMEGAKKYLDEIVETNYQEDGYFETTNKITEVDYNHLAEEKINVYENFYAKENEFDGNAKVYLFNERKSINLPVLFEGKMPNEKDEIALDHVFARNRKIEIGKNITLLKKEYKIVGTVALPDYSALFLNNTDLVMNTNDFCVSILTKEGFEEIENKYITYRYSYRYQERDLAKSEKVLKSDAAMKYIYSTGNTINAFLRADQNQSISFLPMDIGSDGPAVTVFVYILIAMIAFIFAILTNNTIENESVIIGTLRASGYSKKELIWHYLQPTIIIALLGSFIGNLFSYTLMIKPFCNLYYTSYSIGKIAISFNLPSFLLTTIVPIVLMIFINLFMISRKLKLSPLKFLRKDLKKGKDKKAKKLPNVSFIKRFQMRVIGQNKGSYITLFSGIFLASFLLMFGIGVEPLMNHYTETINESLNYEYQYIVKAPVSTDKGEKLFFYELDTFFELGNMDMGVSCYGIKENSAFFKDAYVTDGISISSSLSNKLGLKVNDNLKLTDSLTDKQYNFKISKIYSYSASMSLFMDEDSLLNVLEKPAGTYNCILSNEAIDIDEANIVTKISRKDILGAADQMMKSFGTVITFFNIFSVVIYIVMMYILTKVVIDKNALSISYAKVFGYKRNEIMKLFIAPSTIIVLISLIVCLPIESLLFKACLVFLSSMVEGYLEFYLPVYVYALVVVLGILSYGLITLLHIRDINRIPLTDALKSRE